MSIAPPLTERVLARLGRPRWLWIALWSASSFPICVRRLAAEAAGPVTANWSVEALQRQAQALQAAEQLERKAGAIFEWPFDEAVLARITAILTAVAATIIARLVLASFGL